MGDLNSVYPLLGIVILIVLLCRFDGRFTKMEKELDVIKKQMDALLKRQAKMAPGDMTSSEEMPEKVVAEVLSKEKLLEEELVVQRQSTIVETAVVDNLKDAPKEISDVPEKIQEEIIEKITVEDIAEKDSVISPTPIAAKPITPKPSKKQVNYEKFIGENLFGKIGILIFVIGVGFFVKYAIDKNWINETFRTVLGFLTGGGTAVCCRTLAEEISYIQFTACRWCFRCVLSHGCYRIPLLSYLLADCCIYYSGSYHYIYVCSVCDI